MVQSGTANEMADCLGGGCNFGLYDRLVSITAKSFGSTAAARLKR
jgi:hypothetical protein